MKKKIFLGEISPKTFVKISLLYFPAFSDRLICLLECESRFRKADNGNAEISDTRYE